MKNYLKSIKTVGCVSLLMSSLITPVHAGTSPEKLNRSLTFSVGYLNQSDSESVDALTDQGYTGIALNNDDSDMAFKLAYHQAINQRWGGEIAYVDLGDIDFTPQLTLPVGTTNAQAAQDVVDSLPLRGRGFTIKGTRQFQLGKQWTLQLNAGLFVLKDEREATVGTSRVEENTTEKGVVLGLSTAYPFSQQMKMVLDWDHYYQQRNDIDVVSLGIRYLF